VSRSTVWTKPRSIKKIARVRFALKVHQPKDVIKEGGYLDTFAGKSKSFRHLSHDSACPSVTARSGKPIGSVKQVLHLPDVRVRPRNASSNLELAVRQRTSFNSRNRIGACRPSLSWNEADGRPKILAIRLRTPPSGGFAAFDFGDLEPRHFGQIRKLALGYRGARGELATVDTGKAATTSTRQNDLSASGEKPNSSTRHRERINSAEVIQVSPGALINVIEQICPSPCKSGGNSISTTIAPLKTSGAFLCASEIAPRMGWV